MKVSEMQKSYVVSVEYRGVWPSRYCIDWHYRLFGEATSHIWWLAQKIQEQNGKNAPRENVILCFSFSEFVRSKKRDKALPPVLLFHMPLGRAHPEGGVVRAPQMELVS